MRERIKKLQNALVAPILIKKKENLLYLTGRSFMNGYLLVKPKARINTDRKRIHTDKNQVIFFGDGLEKSPGIHFDFLKNIGIYLGRARVLQLEDQFSFAEYNYIKHKIWNINHGKKKLNIQHQKSPVDYQRQIKDAGEIALIRKSMQIVGKVFEQVRKKLINADTKRMCTEIELARFIKTAGLKLGAQDIAFPPIVASGVNAAVPHHVPSSKRLKTGESIIIDFGFKYKNYCSDFTRTIFLKRVPSRLEKVYNQVEKAYNESINYVNVARASGLPVKACNVYQKAFDVLAEKHLDKYFIHNLGHGCGLEIHELPNLSPNLKDILQDGMVFSIEPGVYISKLGGVRIEDLVYLDRGGVKKFVCQPTNLKNNII